MDGLFVILILIGAFAFTSSNKKKKAQQAAKQRGFDQADAAIQAVQEKIPFSRDEWAAFLKQTEPAKPVAAKPQPAKPANSRPAAVPKAAAKPSVRALEHDEPEGTVSTQGESAAEHAEHRRKVLAEEAQRREEHQAMEDLRAVNLQKLRSAVVMSEILDKPVSLRRREYR